MITETHFRLWMRFGYPLYWPDVCIKKDLLYIPFPIGWKILLERAMQTMIWSKCPRNLECYSAQTSFGHFLKIINRTGVHPFNGFGKGNLTLLCICSSYSYYLCLGFIRCRSLLSFCSELFSERTWFFLHERDVMIYYNISSSKKNLLLIADLS
jgi:hypothetical protein